MNSPKYQGIDYINFLIATQKAYSCTEAEWVHPLSETAPADDAITRLLRRREPSSDGLWQEAQGHVELTQGVLRLR